MNSTVAVELHKSGSQANFTRVPTSGSVGPACMMLPRRIDNDYALGTMPNIVTVKRADINNAGLSVGDFPVNLDNLTQGNDSIDGSTQDRFIYVGNLDDAAAGDDAGDAIFMRIYNF